MFELLWLIPTLPILGFLILALAGRRLPRGAVAAVGSGFVGLAALLTIGIAVNFLAAPPPAHVYTQSLWTWMDVAGLRPEIAFHLDALALVMMLVITVVGFLIHLYSTEYMADDAGYSRFFAYLNLFVGAMLILVMGDNLLLLYLGWEGVGLCSYLLIGFWYTDPANGRAARKAFITTRVGDTAMAIGLFLLFAQLGTLHIQELSERAVAEWAVGSGVAVAAALLLMIGALGKSAQLPLQVWLPDAMAGPTPVSALIHAATMVTAGVYLIARTHVLFTLAPAVLTVVAIIGALTLLLAGFSALTQSDIKRVLAYSTISQLGYMFLALGVGAWSAAMFHFMTHAFFKALLFLSAGAAIMAVHHEQNMFKMGGLRERLPITFWTFLIGAAALAAAPLVTSGFYSKELILEKVWSSTLGHPVLWIAGVVGALITSIYTFRMVFLTFFGEARTEVSHKPGTRIQVPLIVLAVFAVIAGFIELPHTLANLTLFSDFMHTALPATEVVPVALGAELLLQLIAIAFALAGILIAYVLYRQRPEYAASLAQSPMGSRLYAFWLGGWGFDRLYEWFAIRPIVWLAQVNKDDVIDSFYTSIALLHQRLFYVLQQVQTGRMRLYAAGIALGGVITIAIVVLL